MLLGRSAEREALIDASGRHRLVTVVGPGGVGKTTLAKQLLSHDELGSVPYFVDLTGISPSKLIGGIAGSLGLASFNALIETANSENWLLIVDNCEHMLGPVADALETLMQRCPRLRIVCTSREPIEIPDEFILRLEPLSLEGDPSPAARLFVERSRLAAATDTPSEWMKIEEICSVLDGLPLAIELAAAKTATMTLEEILEGLDEPIALLEQPRSRRPQRHVSLRATIAWSYDLLSTDEQRALACLSVLEGSFSLKVAEAAVGVDGVTPLMEGLVEKSLINHVPIAGESWFRILETIRSYGAERLDELGERADVWDRVTAEILRELEELRMGPVRIPPLIKEGFPTVRHVLERCLMGDQAPHRVLRVLGHLWWLEDVGHQPEGSQIAQKAIEKWPEPNPESAIAYGVLAGFQRLAGRYEDAERNARIAIASSNGVGAAFGHRSLGQQIRRHGDWEGALDHFQKAAEAARNDGENGLALEIGLHVAITVARAGEPAKAVHGLEELVADSSPYPLLNQWTRLFLSWVLFDSDPARAHAISEAVLEDDARIEDTWVAAVAHQHHGISALLSSDISRGASHLKTSLELFLQIHNRSDIALTLLAVAALFNRVGDVDRARRVLVATDEYGTMDRYGEFEYRLFDRIGSLPERVNGVEPLTNAKILQLLNHLEAESVHEPDGDGPTFRKKGDMWELSFDGDLALIRDSKGIVDIHTLIRNVGKEISALDLMGSGLSPSPSEPKSDPGARRQYEARIKELESEINEADSDGDPYRADLARQELDVLIDHITSTYGLHGRSRQETNPAERARSAVTSRIRATIKRLRDSLPGMADHLDVSVKTGRFCAYEPPEPVDWNL